MNSLNPSDPQAVRGRLATGQFTDEELREYIVTYLIEDSDLRFLRERKWTVLDVVYGWNTLSEDDAEEEEESRRIQEMFDDWNKKIGDSIFGYGFGGNYASKQLG
ncbi:MAG: hypothetical protein KY428_10435 [Bacteroidetes bacterium]|nr:hypothetical protein [Bacteroidota bacterium]